MLCNNTGNVFLRELCKFAQMHIFLNVILLLAKNQGNKMILVKSTLDFHLTQIILAKFNILGFMKFRYCLQHRLNSNLQFSQHTSIIQQRLIQNPANDLRSSFLQKQSTAFSCSLFSLKDQFKMLERILNTPLRITNSGPYATE